jgi:peptidoglycan/xylan/chitin deacetylase (PgdA/CDA1 family)
LKNHLRLFVAACFYYSGLVKLARLAARYSGPRLIILNYHRADGVNLRGQFRYLRDHYRVMHMEEALAELFMLHEPKRGGKRRTPLVITFDDGYRDSYTHGLALAREMQVPITIFLIPGYIESGDHFWWHEGKNLLENAQVEEVEIEGHRYHLRQPDDRKALEQAIDTRARYATSVAERETFLAAVRQALAIPAPRPVYEDGAMPLTWLEVLEMEQSGWVTFGAHTMHHPVLGYLADVAEVQREVTECRRVLEERLGHPVQLFAYPMGKPEHIGGDGLQAVRDAGYRWAFTTIPEKNTPQTDPYLLRRRPGSRDLHWLELACLLAGLLGMRTRLRQALGKWAASKGTARRK